jgi:hypothetical protein
MAFDAISDLLTSLLFYDRGYIRSHDPEEHHLPADVRDRQEYINYQQPSGRLSLLFLRQGVLI